jgi:phospholipase/carboxylesterase
MFDYPELKTLGRLQVALRREDPRAPSVILLHGYGANAYDLWSLQSEIQIGKKLNWYFPEGILSLDMGPGYSGKAWFPINEKALEKAMLSGQPLDYSQSYPPGMERARDLVLDLIARENLNPETLILGGFSQGAMLALEVALHLPQAPRGLLLFSSTLVCEKQWSAAAERLLKASGDSVEFFQSHGKADPILPFSGAERLRECLEKAGWEPQWSEFNGGHEIPRTVLRDAGFYLKRRI